MNKIHVLIFISIITILGLTSTFAINSIIKNNEIKREQEDIQKLSDIKSVLQEVVKEDEYIVDGSARLDDISDLVGVNMESQEFDSIGGLIIGELGRFPENKEEVNIGNIRCC